MELAELRRLYGYSRMIENRLREEEEGEIFDLALSEAKSYASRLSTWLDEIISIKESDSK